MNVIHQPVLCLNGLWQALNTKTVKEALIAMLGGVDGRSPAALAIDMNFPADEDGNIESNAVGHEQFADGYNNLQSRFASYRTIDCFK